MRAFMSHGEFLAKTILNVGKSCWIVTIRSYLQFLFIIFKRGGMKLGFMLIFKIHLT